MKKKKLIRKLNLNKKSISKLDEKEMAGLKGASILFLCSESCSVLAPCCGPTVPKLEHYGKG